MPHPLGDYLFTLLTCRVSSYAMDVIRECAEAWEKLITGKTQPGSVST